MTILFREDWKKYPGAVIHYETRNPSFKRLAEIYHKMGIENNCFHLSLLDSTLKDVNPHDEDNLTEEQKYRILRECKRNFWYYVREIMLVDSGTGMDGAPFKANRSNIAVYWLYLNNVTFINTVIRQTGKTTTLKGVYSWLLNFGITGATLGLVTKDAGLRTETMNSIKDQFDYLPSYLRASVKRDLMNTEEVNVGAMGNVLKSWISNASPKLAYKVARGFPVGTMGWDEVAFIENVQIAMSSASFAGNFARTALKEAGLPHGTMMFTTAGDIDNKDGAFIYDIVTSSTMFSEAFYDCKDKKELNEVIYTNSLARDNRQKKPIVVVSFSYRQMGYTTEWMKEKLIENALSTEASLDRDLFNMWVSGSSSSPLSEEELKRIRDHEAEEVWREMYAPFNYLLRWYISKEEVIKRKAEGVGFIIGVDTSDGVGRDDIAFYVRDAQTGEIIASALFNEINLITLSNFFVDFLIKHPNALMVMERKSSAPAIIDNMINMMAAKGINPYKRMYNTIFQDKESYPKEYEALSRSRGYDLELYNKYKKHIGFNTSGGNGVTSRSELYSTVLFNMSKYTGHLLRDKILVGQLLALIVKNNRVDHPKGGHDDAVVASLLSYWLLMFGKNLHAYGLDSKSILKKNDVYLCTKFENTKNKYEQREMESIESEITFLLDSLKQIRDPIMIEKVERRIRYLYRDVKDESSLITVEDMLEKIKKESRLKVF